MPIFEAEWGWNGRGHQTVCGTALVLQNRNTCEQTKWVAPVRPWPMLDTCFGSPRKLWWFRTSTETDATIPGPPHRWMPVAGAARTPRRRRRPLCCRSRSEEEERYGIQCRPPRQQAGPRQDPSRAPLRRRWQLLLWSLLRLWEVLHTPAPEQTRERVRLRRRSSQFCPSIYWTCLYLVVVVRLFWWTCPTHVINLSVGFNLIWCPYMLSVIYVSWAVWICRERLQTQTFEGWPAHIHGVREHVGGQNCPVWLEVL